MKSKISLTRVYLTFYFIFEIFIQFPTFHLGLDHSGSQPFIYLCAYHLHTVHFQSHIAHVHVYTTIGKMLVSL